MSKKSEVPPKINFLLNNRKFFNELNNSTNEIFDINIINFFQELSKNIFKFKNLNSYPDLATFGFFCRLQNLKNIKNKYKYEIKNRFGKGITLHFTPSNVPLNFAYSLFMGLITGNICIIKLSSKEFVQTELLIKIIYKTLLLKKFKVLNKKIFLIRYNNSSEINDYLCNYCDVRIIWGGDNAINEIRKSKIKELAYDITFADRYSVCIVNCERYLIDKNYSNIAELFYNDTLAFDQNACSSPRLIFWYGKKNNVLKAKKIFWTNFEKKIKQKKYVLFGNTSVNKLLSQQISAIDLNSLNNSIFNSENIVYRSEIKNIPSNLNKYISPGGFFLEYSSNTLAHFKNNINFKMQTLTYIGFKKDYLLDKLNLGKSRSFDRVVPNGRSSEFSLEWDGYDLLYNLSRKISVV